jgi:hypothetical protein
LFVKLLPEDASPARKRNVLHTGLQNGPSDGQLGALAQLGLAHFDIIGAGLPKSGRKASLLCAKRSRLFSPSALPSGLIKEHGGHFGAPLDLEVEAPIAGGVQLGPVPARESCRPARGPRPH